MGRIYAPPSWRLARQLAADSLLIVWLAGWGVVARGVYHAVNLLARPAEQTAKTAGSLASSMHSTATSVQRVPGLGGTLSEPFDAASRGLAEIVVNSRHQAVSIHQAAITTGWTAFAIPAVMALVLWLPYRLRYIVRARAARPVIDADSDLDLLALRAMANLPMATLAQVSDDPIGAWRQGDREVIARLAELELHRNGLSMPRRIRSGDSHGGHEPSES